MLPDSGSARPPSSSRGRPRLSSLDGLRGVAALVVVLHHALLTWPVLAGQYALPDPASGTWWLTFTPVHLVWAGTEAVLVFFVLSGFVLTSTAMRAARSSRWWASYYGARLVRLYLPVWASLVIAAVLVHTFPRTPRADASWWFNAHDVTVQAHTLGVDALLVSGVSWIHPSLWSLRYEVLFSLALPLYVVLVTRPRLPWWSTACLSLVVVGVAQSLAWEVVSWLAVFGVGASLAAGRDRLRLTFSRWNARPLAGLRWGSLGVLGVLALLSEWWVRGSGAVLQDWMPLVRPVTVVGAAVMVAAALGCPSFRGLLDRAPLQWLGRISFSLYLVHEPVVVSVASVVGGSRTGVLTTLTVGIGLAFLLAVVLHRWVEVPSHRLARRVARALQADPRGPHVARPAATSAVEGVPVLERAR